MPRMTIEDLKRIREGAKQTLTLRSGQARAKVTIHMGTCGISADAREIVAALLKEMNSQGISDVLVATSGCAGLCSREPMATVELIDQAPVKYVDLNPEKIVRILKQHVIGGSIVKDCALASGCETTA
jgi:NADP-reducing hydrogenase subunit HndB